jgi:sulfate transport system ATP-binding protein
MSIQIKHIDKWFQTKHILKDINFDIANNELIALLGPSGCGKTTLLRIIAGLEQQNAGDIFFDDVNVSGFNTAQRHIGFMFQSYALFPHMTVFDNIAFGLTVQRHKTQKTPLEIRNIVNELIVRVQLEGFENVYPHSLSGGQKQRVALARAIATTPKVLLLDEPFAALDTQVRQSLRRWLRDLLSELKITSIFVTHDQEEAFDIADKIVVMNQGKVEQIGSAEEIYQHPKTPFVQSFIGQSNEIDLSIWPSTSQSILNEYPEGKTEGISFIRPHDIEVKNYECSSSLKARLIMIKPLGAKVFLVFKHAHLDQMIVVEISRCYYEDFPLQLNKNYYLKPRNIRSYDDMDYVI